MVSQGLPFPSLIEAAGDNAKHAFVKFFLAEIDNHNTRLAYARAVYTFLAWCEERGLTLEQVDPLVVSAYIRARSKVQAPTTVKQHLAAIRRLFDHLYVERAMSSNPASPVRGRSTR